MRFLRQWDDPPDAIDVDALRDALTSFPLALVVLFGSYAGEAASPDSLSDLDLAVEFDAEVGRDRKVELVPDVMRAVQRTTGCEAVDLVDLESVGPAIGYAALANGVLVVGDRERAIALETEFLLKKLDFQPIKRMWDAAQADRIEEGTFGRS